MEDYSRLQYINIDEVTLTANQNLKEMKKEIVDLYKILRSELKLWTKQQTIQWVVRALLSLAKSW